MEQISGEISLRLVLRLCERFRSSARLLILPPTRLSGLRQDAKPNQPRETDS